MLPDKHAYLHYPNLHLKFYNLDTLYKDAPDIVIFETSDLGYVESSSTRRITPGERSQNYAIALGGSTTESAVVREGRRWTDLLNIPTLNYGKSKVFSVQSYFNLRYILEVLQFRPQYLLIMHGVNDIWTYIGDGADDFHPETYKYIVGNPWTDFVVKYLYLPTFVWRRSKEYDYYAFYLYEARRSLAYPPMSNAAFQNFLGTFEETLYPKLKNLYQRMALKAELFDAQVIILTQPHAYKADYTPYREDLRSYPVVNGRRMTLRQSEKLMDSYKNLLFDIAQELNHPLVDVANCFEKVNVGDLLYDSVHLTERGSRYFADCVNGPLESKIVFLEDPQEWIDKRCSRASSSFAGRHTGTTVG